MSNDGDRDDGRPGQGRTGHRTVELDIPELLVDRMKDVYGRAGSASVSAFVIDAIRHRLEELERERLSLEASERNS